MLPPEESQVYLPRSEKTPPFAGKSGEPERIRFAASLPGTPVKRTGTREPFSVEQQRESDAPTRIDIRISARTRYGRHWLCTRTGMFTYTLGTSFPWKILIHFG